jgi:ABC-type transport system involved in cytochrome bd biosynthesis fused ATPase/permease subunit
MTPTSAKTKEPAPRTNPYVKDSIYLIRTSVQANIMLSQMADQKASILLGATFVVFTLVIGQAGKGEIALPLMILACFAFFSALCAVAVVMPSVKKVPKSAESSNLLFFGVFSQMGEKEFADTVLEELKDEERLFRLMLRDLYQNGQVLQRKKYRFLSYAYGLFLIGLTGTLVAFLAGL